MKLVLAVVGTLGDALPAVAVGRAMRERGHAVAVIASPVFADMIERAGLEPLPFGTAADYQALVDHPDYWDPERGFGWFAKHAVLPSLRPVVALVERASRRGDTVVGAMNYAHGASHAAERLGLPTARLVTQPAMLDALSAGMPGRFARVVGSLETFLDHRGRTLGATEARAPRRRALVA
ncbi:MAG: glycosyltransferase, partial [Candidatus Rokuibacteriota bacterium]